MRRSHRPWWRARSRMGLRLPERMPRRGPFPDGCAPLRNGCGACAERVQRGRHADVRLCSLDGDEGGWVAVCAVLRPVQRRVSAESRPPASNT
eukprot:6822776-Prymnesium_polylepis.1